jgi:hypothetical protein
VKGKKSTFKQDDYHREVRHHDDDCHFDKVGASDEVPLDDNAIST